MEKRHSSWYRIAVIVLLMGSLLEVLLLFFIYCFPDGILTVQSYHFLIMDTEIMEPDISKGSLLMVKEEHENKGYEKGDVIAFKISNQKVEIARIIHLLDQGNSIYYQTKKNGNTLSDPSNVQVEEVLGRVQLQIPYIGSIGMFLISQEGIVSICVILIISGYIVFHRQEEEIEVKDMNKEDKNKDMNVEEQGKVHMSIIANEKIERKVIPNAKQQEKIVQAKLQDVHKTTKPVSMKEEPLLQDRQAKNSTGEVKKEASIQKERVVQHTRPIEQQARPVEQRIQKQREPLRTEMFQPRPKTQAKTVEPTRPQRVQQPRPARVERASIKQEQPQILVREQRANPVRSKMDVREQLELQRQRVREEMEQLERARALREANKK